MDKVINADLVVVGAGYAGICTAISAARNGIKVALINDRTVPGGNASSEHRVHINGGANNYNSYYAREAGISDEIKMDVFHYNPKYNIKQEFHLNDMAMLQKILDEKNIEYFPETAVYDCECENNKIAKAFAFNAKNENHFTFISPLFCDASGDGILAYKAGAEYRVGREAKSEYNESLAPEQSDEHVMGSCLLFNARHTGKPVKYTKPKFAYDFVKDGIINYFNRPETGRELPGKDGPYNGMWWLEYGGLSNTIEDADDIDFELKKIIYGYWDYIKNSGLYPDSYDCAIDWIAPYSSKRESRRFMAEKVLSQNDIQSGIDYEDSVATGGWSLDIHDVGGVYGDGLTSAFGPVPSMYNIPLSIMISKDIDNLFLGGRIVSCTHVALGSIRVMQTLGAMGQGIGVAAALCKKYNENPINVDKEHSTEIQEILQKNGQYILGKKEDCGLAKNAKITTSSEKLFKNLCDDQLYILENDVKIPIPVSKNATGKIQIKLKNTSDFDIKVKYQVYGENSIKNYTKGKLISENEIVVTANFNGFVSFDINYADEKSKVFFVLCSNKNLSIYGSAVKITGSPQEGVPTPYGNEETIAFTFKGVESAPDIYSATNVVNGYSRPYGKANCWISNIKDNQWIELEFNQPTNVNELQIYFNSQYETDHFNHPIKQLITDYKINITTMNGNINKSIIDNYQGQNIIKLNAENTTKIRINFTENNGSNEFEVFSIKVF